MIIHVVYIIVMEVVFQLGQRIKLLDFLVREVKGRWWTAPTLELCVT